MNPQHQSETVAHIPKKAIFKHGKSDSTIIQKRELIEYPATALSQTVTVGENDENKSITFNVSGDAMIDGRESYFSVKMNTNKWTAHLSGDITSIVKRVIVSLPSNSNLILEDISDYNTLQSICHLANANDDQFDSSWVSGLNSMSNFNKKNGANQARRYLNLHEEGDARTMVFQLSLSGILSSESYIPLVLLNGIKIQIFLERAGKCLLYDPADEANFDTIFDKTDAPFTKQYSTMSAQEKTDVTDALKLYTGKGDPNNTTPITYTLTDPKFHAQTIFMSSNYIDGLIKASESQNGITLNFDTYRMNTITPESPNINFAFHDALQNLKTMFMVTQNRASTTNTHYNYFLRGIKNFTFRVGSRIYNKVDCECPSLSLASTLISLGKFGTYGTHNLSHTSYPRSKNVHIFDFQTARIESKSANLGLNTCNGRLLRIELECYTSPSKTIISSADNSTLATLSSVGTYDDIKVCTFMEFSKMIRINGSGILCTE